MLLLQIEINTCNIPGFQIFNYKQFLVKPCTQLRSQIAGLVEKMITHQSWLTKTTGSNVVTGFIPRLSFLRKQLLKTTL